MFRRTCVCAVLEKALAINMRCTSACISRKKEMSPRYDQYPIVSEAPIWQVESFEYCL